MHESWERTDEPVIYKKLNKLSEEELTKYANKLGIVIQPVPEGFDKKHILTVTILDRIIENEPLRIEWMNKE